MAPYGTQNDEKEINLSKIRSQLYLLLMRLDVLDYYMVLSYLIVNQNL